MDNLEVQKWDKVYQTRAQNLPWFGIPFPLEACEYLESLPKSEELIITGVGVGDTANTLHSQGFVNITGTDLSPVAIETASKRFPYIKFKTLATQALGASLSNSNTFDWLNLHQVSPDDLGDYISGLALASKNLCLAWIINSDGKETAQSHVHSGKVYFHNPEYVKAELEKRGMKLQKQFSFQFQTNPRAETVAYEAVGQTYTK